MCLCRVLASSRQQGGSLPDSVLALVSVAAVRRRKSQIPSSSVFTSMGWLVPGNAFGLLSGGALVSIVTQREGRGSSVRVRLADASATPTASWGAPVLQASGGPHHPLACKIKRYDDKHTGGRTNAQPDGDGQTEIHKTQEGQQPITIAAWANFTAAARD